MSGDGLVRPVNAPEGGQVYPGVQPGTSALQFANTVLVFGPAGSAVGIFIYPAGTSPGPGNPPIISITEASADPFGNLVDPGVTIGLPTATQIILSTSGGAGIIDFAMNTPGFLDAILGSVVSGFAQVRMGGPVSTTTGHTDQVSQQWNSSDGTVSANGVFVYRDINAILHSYASYGASGFTVTGSIVAVDPTTGTVAVPAVSEGWHAITLDANWSTLAGQPVPSYRFLADAGRKIVELCGAAQFNVNIANTNLNGANPLPAVYRPLTAPFIAGAPGSAGVNILANGVIVAAQAPGQTTVFCNFNGIYPVDL
jgi:hypothetical protein